VSYEVSIGFVLISGVLWVGSFNMTAIVEMQRHHFLFTNGFGFNPLFLPMAVVFFISSLAETARAPFDLTEAESELVAGYQTEYSSMSFALFWLGEYANVILMCALNAILFWGGYLPPVDWAPLYVIPGIFWLFLKILIFFFIFSWVKATVPRYRYDQLMRLGWKIFLPISLLWVVLVSGYLMLTRYKESAQSFASIAPPGLVYACQLSGNGRSFRVSLSSPGTGNKWTLSGEKGAPGYPYPAPMPSLIDPGSTFQWVAINRKKNDFWVDWHDVTGSGKGHLRDAITGTVFSGPCQKDYEA
jgi:NADH dehydrogenase